MAEEAENEVQENVDPEEDPEFNETDEQEDETEVGDEENDPMRLSKEEFNKLSREVRRKSNVGGRTKIRRLYDPYNPSDPRNPPVENGESYVEDEEPVKEDEPLTEKIEDYQQETPKKPGEEYEDPEKRIIVVTEEEYEQENSDENEPDEETRQNLIDVWQDEENAAKLNEAIAKYPKADVVVTNKAAYLFRDIPLYKIEPILLAVVILFGLFFSVLSILGVMDMMFLIVPFILVSALSGGIWIFKFLNYMPNKERRIGIKVFSSGGVALFCEKLKDNKISFNKNSESSVVTNLRAHTDVFSGHPFVVAIENHFENIDILKLLKGKINPRTSAKMIAALDEAMAHGVRSERMKNTLMGKQVDNTILVVLLAAVLLLLGWYIFFMAAPMNDSIQALSNSVSALPNELKAVLATQTTSTTGQNVDISQGGG